MAEVKERSSLNIADLPSNSNSKPTSRPKPSKIVTSKVTARKPGIGRKFADVFLGEEVKDVKSYILQDVIIPTIKNTILDVVCGGAEMLLLGRTSGRRSNNYRPNGSYTSYGNYYYGGNPTQKQPQTNYQQQSANRYGVDDIIFPTHGDASNLLAAMFDYMKDYDGMISVADYYQMVGHPSVFTDNSWGWTDLGNATIRRVRDGYLIVLPRPVTLN